MRVGVVRESRPQERRVAATEASTAKLIELGFTVHVQAGAGAESEIEDAAYVRAGAEIVTREQAWGCDVVLGVSPPTLSSADGPGEVELLAPGSTLVGFLQPDLHPGLLEALAARKVNVIAVERVPRITRAQSMDALSSIANIAGYRAVIEAAQRFGSFFTAQFTAAGKVPPARVLVIGAGVAGLASIGTARSLGAVVRAFDTRAAVQDQVQSMGAEFLTVAIEEEGDGIGGYAKTMSKAFIEAELALFRSQAPEVNIVITTALIPGRRAPILWTRDMVEAMAPGSVVVDLAASQGGNCELTEPGQRTVHNGVHIIGYTDLSSRMPATASRMFAANLVHLLADLGGPELDFDLDDEIVRGVLVLRDGVPPVLPELAERDRLSAELPGHRKRRETGKFTRPRPAQDLFPVEPPPAPTTLQRTTESVVIALAEVRKRPIGLYAAALTSLALLAAWGLARAAGTDMAAAVPGASEFIEHLTVFTLACVVGWHLVWNVTPALHTPLMSVTNAISGIIVLGGLVFAGSGTLDLTAVLGVVAILFASINIAGGFLVTQRMLRMFHK